VDRVNNNKRLLETTKLSSEIWEISLYTQKHMINQRQIISPISLSVEFIKIREGSVNLKINTPRCGCGHI
jgi:hypothetical protein